MSDTSLDPKEPIVTVGTGGTTDPGTPIPGTGTTLNPSEPPKILPTTAKLVGIGGDTLNGVYGGSTKQNGVIGESTEGVGVSGFGPWGVLGLSTDGDGVVGNGRRGVVGESQTFQGVYGKSRDDAGVVGDGGGWGVIGRSDANTGISGESTSGVGVHGKGGKLAGFFEGDVEVTGDIRLANADCAEDFDICSSELVEPGAVMVLGNSEGVLYVSQRPYDKRVAGVVSGAGNYKPAIVLDKQNSQNDRRPLALLGKVYCKVDACYGQIEVGDLLTTSATPGHAMKASDPFQAFGAVIGKALRPLKEGQALIPILIALQ